MEPGATDSMAALESIGNLSARLPDREIPPAGPVRGSTDQDERGGCSINGDPLSWLSVPDGSLMRGDLVPDPVQPISSMLSFRGLVFFAPATSANSGIRSIPLPPQAATSPDIPNTDNFKLAAHFNGTGSQALYLCPTQAQLVFQ